MVKSTKTSWQCSGRIPLLLTWRLVNTSRDFSIFCMYVELSYLNINLVFNWYLTLRLGFQGVFATIIATLAIARQSYSRARQVSLILHTDL